MKPHRTMTITIARLRKLRACSVARSALRHWKILPAKISTDPERNLTLAIVLCQAGIPGDSWFDGETVSRWIPWLRQNLSTSNDQDACDAEYTTTLQASFGHGENDPTICAQILAMVADLYFTERGR